MGMEHFPVEQQARNQLTLYVNQAELILRFITSQDMTGQFGNLLQMLLDFTANPKQKQKSCKGKLGPLGHLVLMGVGSPQGVFRALDGSVSQKNCLCL